MLGRTYHYFKMLYWIHSNYNYNYIIILVCIIQIDANDNHKYLPDFVSRAITNTYYYIVRESNMLMFHLLLSRMALC